MGKNSGSPRSPRKAVPPSYMCHEGVTKLSGAPVVLPRLPHPSLLSAARRPWEPNFSLMLRHACMLQKKEATNEGSSMSKCCEWEGSMGSSAGAAGRLCADDCVQVCAIARNSALQRSRQPIEYAGQQLGHRRCSCNIALA